MFIFIFLLVNDLSQKNNKSCLLYNPTCHLCSKFYVQFVISTVKTRQISNIHMPGFSLKCKNHLILPTDQSKIVSEYD